MNISPSVNSFIKHIDVLQLLSRQVKPLLPLSCSCPLCKGQLQAYAETAGGAWYDCISCGFSGDSIQLYAQAKNLTTTAAIDKLRELIPAVSQVEIADYNKYVCDELPKRLACNAFWRNAKSRILELDIAGQTLLQQYGLYTGYPWRVAPPFGLASKNEVADLPDGPAVKGNVLVLPITDLPGKIIGFQFYGNKSAHTYIANKKTKDDCNGFIFGSYLRTANPMVIAVDNPLLAMHVHIAHQVSTGRNDLAVVSWAPGMNIKWYSFQVDRLLLVGTTYDGVLSAQAATCGARNILVTTGMPELSDPLEVAKYVEDVGYTRLINQWYGTSTAPVVTHVENPGLITDENDEKGLEYNATKVIDRREGWFVNGKCISNVKLVPEQIIHYEPSERNECTGHLLINNRKIPFTVDVNALLTTKNKWLMTTVVSATGITPTINRRWAPQLYDIGSQMYKPALVTVREGVSWDDQSGAWRTPRCMIMPKSSPVSEVVVDVSGIAGYKLLPMNKQEIQVTIDSMTDEDMSAGAWALLTLILHNTLTARTNKMPISIGLICDELRAHPLIHWLNAGIKLDDQELNRKEVDPERILTAHRTAGLPCILYTSAVSKASVTKPLIACRTSSNVIAEAISGMDVLRGLYPTWMFIPVLTGKVPSAGLCSILLTWLQLFADDSQIPETYKELLDVIGSWADKQGERAVIVHARARRLLKIDERMMTSPAKLMFALFCRLTLDANYKFTGTACEVFRAKYVSKNGVDTVIIDLHRLVNSLSNQGYPAPTWSAVVQSLVDDRCLIQSQPRRLTLTRKWWDELMTEVTDALRAEGRPETEITQLLLPALSESPACSPVPDSADEHASNK